MVFTVYFDLSFRLYMITQIKEYALIKLSCITAVIAEVEVLQEERKKIQTEVFLLYLNETE